METNPITKYLLFVYMVLESNFFITQPQFASSDVLCSKVPMRVSYRFMIIRMYRTNCGPFNGNKKSTNQ